MKKLSIVIFMSISFILAGCGASEEDIKKEKVEQYKDKVLNDWD